LQKIVVKNNKFKEDKEILAKVLKTFKKIFIQIGIFSFFINILMLAAPMYMLAVYDIVMPAKSLNTLLLITAIIILMFISIGILEFIRNKVLIILGNRLDAMLNEKVYHATFDMALKYPGKTGIEPISDLNNIKNFLSGQGIIAFFDTPWFPIYLSIMFLFSPIYGIYGIGATIIIILFTVINNKVTKKGLEEAIKHQRKANNMLNNQIKNAEVVESMGMRKPLFKKWMKIYYEYLKVHTESASKSALYTNLSKSFRMMSSSLMYGVGAILAITGQISPGMIIAGAVLMGRALQPITMLISTWKQFINAKSSYSKLNELLNEFDEQEEKLSLPEPKGNLSLINVVTLPPLSQNPVLKNITMHINAGEIVGIIGPSGAGKSSFARTVLGIWKPASGKENLDGAELSQYNRDELGKYIGYLPQDIELFEGTIAENIARFTKAEDNEIIEAAKLAGVHEMILSFEHGYNTKIGPGGITLSGGQRQRVALARAVFRMPKVIVLDEPNSNLDDAGEKALMNTILKLKQLKRTVILITHKIPILQTTDKLALFRNGTLAMYGPTQEVLNKLKGQ